MNYSYLVLAASLVTPMEALSAEPATPSADEATAVRSWSKADEQALRAAITDAPSHGLTPSMFRRSLPAATRRGAQRDEALSEALLAYARVMLDGAVDPSSLKHLIEPYEVTDLSPWKERLHGGEAMDSLLADLAPTLPAYAALQAELEALRQTARDGWLPVPGHVRLGPDEPAAAAAVRTVRARLLDEQFVNADCAPPQAGPPAPGQVEVPPCVLDGVKAFQRSRGITEDGAVGPATRREMNITPRARIATLRANLERLRWREAEPAERRVEVNIAAFTLSVHRPSEAPVQMNVITGTVANATPLFRDVIERVVFNPYWNVPRSITMNEILPQLTSGTPTAVLASKNMEVVANGQVVSPGSVDWSQAQQGEFPYRVRQRPGARNALGQIKFLFPNKWSIYLHDTPSESLFDRSDRTFSHGCVRVERPSELAVLLLGPQGWSGARVDQALADDAPVTAELDEPVAVVLTYQTAHDVDGRIHYEQDVYSVDKQVLAALSEKAR